MTTKMATCMFAVSLLESSESSKFSTLKDAVVYLIENGKTFNHQVENFTLEPTLGAEKLKQGEALPNAFVSCTDESIATFKAFLSKGEVDVNEVDEASGMTLLMYACGCGHYEVVKLLLKHRICSVSTTDGAGWTALHYAVWGRNIKCIKSVLVDALLSQGDRDGRTPLMLAAYMGDLTICQLLLKKGASAVTRDDTGRTVLHWAVLSREVLVLEHLYRKCRPLRALWYEADNEGASLLHYAVLMPSLDVIKLLLTKDYNGDAKDGRHIPSNITGLTPFHWACAAHHTAAINLLLEHDPRLATIMSNGGLSPLHIAAATGSNELCAALLSNDAPVDYRDVNGLTPLHLACRHGHTVCVEILLDNEADVDALNTIGCSGLHYASCEGHSGVIAALLQHNADRDLPSGVQQNCPIHFAAIGGRRGAMAMLLRHGTEANTMRGSDARTALHLAALHGRVSCCELLLAKGASVNRTDSTSEGLTPLDLAILNGQSDCAEFLLARGARTAGGAVHRAVCTIQLSWKFYVHKRRLGVRRLWAIRRLQYYFHQWRDRKRAGLLRQVRQRRREAAAILIQKKWAEYIERKRDLTTSYHALKKKLIREQMATKIIVKELKQQISSISLPPRVKVRSSEVTKTAAKMLRSGLHPTPLYPTYSLLFGDMPHEIGDGRVKIGDGRANTVPAIAGAKTSIVTTKATHTAPSSTHHDSTDIRTEDNPTTCDTTDGSTAIDPSRPLGATTMIMPSKKHGPPIKTKSSPAFTSRATGMSTISAGGETSTLNTNIRDKASLNTRSTGHMTLPLISSNNKVSSPGSGRIRTETTHIGAQQDKGNISLPPVSHTHLTGKEPEATTDRQRALATSLSSHPQTMVPMKLDTNPPSTTKARPVGQRSRKTDKKLPQKYTKDLRSKDQASLVLTAQRYNKLQEVLQLLQQAKEAHELSEDPSEYQHLKAQIHLALEEAVRLRADTQKLHDKLSNF